MTIYNCRIASILWLCYMLFFAQKVAFAQDNTLFEGRVINQQGKPIAGATVYLYEKQNLLQTDSKGLFQFKGTTDKYKIKISKIGYKDFFETVSFLRGHPLDFQLDDQTVELNEVVVTATRTEKNINDVPLPVTIIGKEEIKQKAFVRLNEVLAEQTGVVLAEDHGTGIQLQGLDAKYTLILIDGEPIIGRSSGTLELSRITLGNVERIEILKGPSSSLYGSEAMAGVINIITKSGQQGTQLGLSTRYGTHHALDLTLDGNVTWGKTNVYAALNRFSNNGYGYGDGTTSKTVPPFYGYTAHTNIKHQLTSKLSLRLGMRYTDEYANDEYTTNVGTDKQWVTSKFLRRDLTILPSIEYRFSDRHISFLRANQSFYETDTRINLLEGDEFYNHDFFDQKFSRLEWQHDYKVTDLINLTAGTGFTDEWLKANRYEDKKEFKSYFAYLQADVKLSERFNLIAGGRFDGHSVYASQFSPKVSAQYRFHSKLKLKASLGSAYKAPDFRELYLNWTNPTQGYSVFGAEDAASRLEHLVQMGEISEILYDPKHIQALDAERSWNYQFGAEFSPIKNLIVSGNFFYNNVSNLIETFILATKKNGKSVYTYSNQENVLIKGVESSIDYSWNDFHLKLSGQYLHTANVEVKEAIEQGKQYYTRDETGYSRLVRPEEYGGLFNRSKYSGNMSASYNYKKPALVFTFRWNYRGRFGIRDIDGNGILNLDEEYAPGYSLLNASVVKSFSNNRFSVSLSAENLTNIRRTGIATMPGRLFFAGLSYRIIK